jgi:hypothetical protein
LSNNKTLKNKKIKNKKIRRREASVAPLGVFLYGEWGVIPGNGGGGAHVAL